MAICCINGITVSPIASADPCVAQARVGSTFVGTTGLIYILNGQDPKIAENWKLIEFEHSHSINELTDVDTVTIPPTLNSLLTWTGNKWQPTEFTLPNLYAWNIIADNINWNGILSNSALNIQDALNILDDHKHSAQDITSGILPIERGGTGASNSEIARNNLGLGVNSSPQFTNLNVTNSLIVNGVEITGVGGTGGGGEMEVHALNGPYHIGQLDWNQLNKLGSNLSDLQTKQHSSLTGIGANDHHNQIHSITGSDHTVTGNQYSVIGLSATNTLGVLASTFDGAANHNTILRSGNNGDLILDILYAPQISTIAGDLLLNPFGEIVLPNDKGIRSQEFNSSFPIEGWQIDETNISGVSLLTIGKIQADELSVRIFVADETRIDRGDEYWAKSYGIVANEFTTPAIDGTVLVTFENSPALDGAIFSNNDWLLFRIIDIDTGLEVKNIWGQVSGYDDNGNDTQSWTFTLRQGPTNVLVKKGVTAVDFGQSGQAVIHLSTIDDNGSPYIKLRRWEGANPFTPSNFTDYVVIGDLDSLANSYYSPIGDGLYIQGPTDEQFIVADENGLQIRGAGFKLFNGVDQTVDIASSDGSVKLGTDISNASTTSFDFNGTTGDIVLRGSVEAANGIITINDIGFNINVDEITNFSELESYKFSYNNNVIGGMFSFSDSGTLKDNIAVIAKKVNVGSTPLLRLLSENLSGNSETVVEARDASITDFTQILLNANPSSITIKSKELNIQTPLGTGAVNLTIGGSVFPSATLAYDLGSALLEWDTIYARNVVVTNSISGPSMSGPEWQYSGDITIDANSPFNTTVTIVNQDAIGVASLIVEGNITLGGTVDGVDIAAHVAGVGNDVHGLGTIATQNANSIAITGGSITGITDLAIADGGTGASNAANARINLGLGPNNSPIFTNLTLSGNLIISGNISNPSGNLLINPAVNLIIPNDKGIGSSTFSSGFPIQGWKIDKIISGQSGLTIGKIQADELSVKIFVADETRIDRGDEYWAKSYGIIAQDFTTPAINGTVSIKFENSAALTGAIFSNNDWILIRVIDIGVGLEVSNIWGQVNTYVNNNDGTQNWTFTLRSGLVNSSIKSGSIAINFGQANQGIIHLSTVDDNGAPYIKMRRWTGANPIAPSNFTDYVIIGSLNGLTVPSYSPSGDGLYIRSGASENQFIVADNNGLQIRGVDLKLFNGTNQTVNLSNTGTDVWIGTSASDKRLSWNGTTLSVTGQIVVQSGSSGYSNITDKPTSLSGINSTEGTKLSGIQAGATVGATWGTNLNSIPDRFGNSPTVAGLYLTPTNLGYFDGSLWKAWLANTGEFYFGGNSGAHLEWDGLKLKGIGTDGSIEQWSASSLDGKFYAGGGTVVISSLGLDIASYSGASLNPTENINAIAWWKQPASIGTQNFVTNSSFEINTSGWSSSWGDTIVRSNEQALYGSFSLKITSAGSAGHGAFTDVSGLIAGQTYTISAWFYAPTSYGTNDLRLRIYNGANFNNAILSSNITERNQWVRRILTLTPTQTTIRILPYGSHSVNGLIFYVDGVQLERNVIATPYVEGLQNSPLSRIWGGETNAGPSLQFDINPIESDGPRMFIQGFKGNNGDGITTLWLQNINSVVGIPGLFAARNSLTDSITFSGNVRSNADFLPNTNEGFNLGTASVRWNTLYVKQISADTISGDTMSGAEWEYNGNMIIDALGSSNTTVSITNQGTGVASLIVEGDITLGGTVDGVDIAAHNHSGGSNGVQLSHAGLSNLTGNDHHTQYVHVSTARTITAQHTFANTLALAPFLISGNSVDVLVSRLNSDLLDGQHGSFYQDVTNINAGRLSILYGGTNASTAANARTNLELGTGNSPEFTRLTLNQTTGTSPLVISSTTLNTNLNSDLLDGQHGSYYQNASNINAGTLADARLSSNVALKNAANVFSANQTINGNLTVDTNVLFVDATNNNVGIGTSTPSAKLDVDGEIISDSLIVNGEIKVYQGDLKIFGYNPELFPSLVIDNNNPLLYVDFKKMSIGINRDPDSQFSLDVAGALRAEWLIGPHAIQLSDAELIAHYDGPGPFESNFTGTASGHKGQVATVTGGVIYRPGKFGKAIQTAEATTNLVTNPSFETNTTGWSTWLSSSISRTSTESIYGDYSLLVTPSSSSNSGTYFTLSVTAEVYSVSIWFLGTAGLGYRIFVTDTSAAIINSGVTFTATGSWQQVSFTYTDTASATRRFYITKAGVANTNVFYVDAIQIEQKAYATPYCDGSLGTGHTWTVPASPHASTSRRTNAYITYPASVFDATYTIMAWFYIRNPNSSSINSNGEYIFSTNGGTGYVRLYRRQATNQLWLHTNNGSNNAAMTPSIANIGVGWHHVAATFDGANSSLYLDGILLNGPATAYMPTGFTSVSVGINWNGLIDEFVILSRAADAAEIRSIYESNAPVFAESSTNFFKSFANTPVEINEEGLFVEGDTLGPIFAIIGTSSGKDWGGFVGSEKLGEGDLLIGTKNTSYVHWDSSESKLTVSGEIIAGSGSIVGPLTLGTNGGIYQGTGTFASPTTGLKLWNQSGIGRLAGYNSSVLQWSADTDGRLYAGAGNVKLDSNGISINTSDGAFTPSSIDWKQDALQFMSICTFSVGGTGPQGRVETFNSVNLELKASGTLYLTSGTGLISLESTIDGNFGTWTNLTFGTGWSNLGGTFDTCRFRKVGDLVMLRGTATSGSTNWSNANPIGTLPIGFRPPTNRTGNFVCAANGSIAKITVQPDGTIRWNSGGGSASFGWISLDGIVFSVL